MCRAGCQACAEVLLSLGKAMEAEVEILVKELLQKSSDTNKFIRQKSSTKSSFDFKYFATLCCKFGKFEQIVVRIKLRRRSDANTALDVLAENLSVYKVGAVSF